MSALATVTYEAYKEALDSDGEGRIIPDFADLPTEEQKAWHVAAETAIEHGGDEDGDEEEESAITDPEPVAA